MTKFTQKDLITCYKELNCTKRSIIKANTFANKVSESPFWRKHNSGYNSIVLSFSKVPAQIQLEPSLDIYHKTIYCNLDYNTERNLLSEQYILAIVCKLIQHPKFASMPFAFSHQYFLLVLEASRTFLTNTQIADIEYLFLKHKFISGIDLTTEEYQNEILEQQVVAAEQKLSIWSERLTNG